DSPARREPCKSGPRPRSGTTRRRTAPPLRRPPPQPDQDVLLPATESRPEGLAQIASNECPCAHDTPLQTEVWPLARTTASGARAPNCPNCPPKRVGAAHCTRPRSTSSASPSTSSAQSTTSLPEGGGCSDSSSTPTTDSRTIQPVARSPFNDDANEAFRGTA